MGPIYDSPGSIIILTTVRVTLLLLALLSLFFVIIAEVDNWSILHYLHLLDYAKMQAMTIFRFGD